MMKSFLFAFTLLSLSACGFRPLYAGSSFSGVEGQMIKVAEIDGRSGYLLRQQLIRELATGLPGLEESAILTVTLDEGLTRATLLPDGAVSRSFLNADGKYALQSESGVITGNTSVQIPYAATRSPYADVSAQINASERAMSDLARRIVENLRIQAQTDNQVGQ